MENLRYKWKSNGLQVLDYHNNPALWGVSGSNIGRIGVYCLVIIFWVCPTSMTTVFQPTGKVTVLDLGLSWQIPGALIMINIILYS